jgi:hypothetical protein
MRLTSCAFTGIAASAEDDGSCGKPDLLIDAFTRLA